jgi:hypothetical protein
MLLVRLGGTHQGKRGDTLTYRSQSYPEQDLMIGLLRSNQDWFVIQVVRPCNLAYLFPMAGTTFESLPGIAA